MIKKLAKIKEEQGLIAEAADLMQEIAVGSVIFILLSPHSPLNSFFLDSSLIINIFRLKLLVLWLKLRKSHSFLNKYETFHADTAHI